MALDNPWNLPGRMPLEMFHHICKRKFTSYENIIFYLYQYQEPADALNNISVFACKIRKHTGAKFRSIYSKGFEWPDEAERLHFKKQLDEIFRRYSASEEMAAICPDWAAYVWPDCPSWDL